jgi:hypothetical protein
VPIEICFKVWYDYFMRIIKSGYERWGKKYYEKHKFQTKERVMRWKRKNLYLGKIKKVCVVCNKEFLTKGNSGRQIICSEYCVKERLKERFRDYNKRLKERIVRYYTNGKMCCACCGENEIDFLSIDHIIPESKVNPGNHKNRETNLCFYLRRNKFPKGYQILCFNCNYGKRNKDDCPHKLKK